ncbi:hypothetical protein AK812_SmicGene4690 [Symbiodinium microadriaticum]|uniref:Uncharacterized protein n=1 Tax=Symbiodinium microadriaticum TaxID=2951 RepID=A0A1Q9EVR5_SYMMI|nr:hypothetical protein AK812_SmicGene4690 [Symbiodinium microadriaticum]
MLPQLRSMSCLVFYAAPISCGPRNLSDIIAVRDVKPETVKETNRQIEEATDAVETGRPRSAFAQQKQRFDLVSPFEEA